MWQTERSYQAIFTSGEQLTSAHLIWRWVLCIYTSHTMLILLTCRPYKTDPTGNKQIHSYQQMLEVLNHILTTAPHWTVSILIFF